MEFFPTLCDIEDCDEPLIVGPYPELSREIPALGTDFWYCGFEWFKSPSGEEVMGCGFAEPPTAGLFVC